MVKPKVLILSGYGLNCEEEEAFAFELAGGESRIVHINDLIDKKVKISDYQILVFPGGFSFGDDTGSGKAYANRIRDHLWEEVKKFVSEDKLMVGFCNGFQIMANLGLVPALDGKIGERQVALQYNKNSRYINRWVDLEVSGRKTPWLLGIDKFSCPIAHGEGRFYTDPETLIKINERGLAVLKYYEGEICKYQNIEPNPNGSLESIAGIVDETGKIFGLMPHPERALFFNQRPDAPLLKEKYKREGVKIPKEGPGMQIFKNGIAYFK
ncbi:phosphoribosylformylglycinamidine synthase subunit PurQ [Candidatus Daviesbacteria bacterium]|nr:phosphoribosylformylglycinamidine synthase subunit PurQ [Candidatus Daviesbacteria bacterium]